MAWVDPSVERCRSPTDAGLYCHDMGAHKDESQILWYFSLGESDDIIWKNSKSLNGVRVKEVYQILMDKMDPQHSPIFPATFWKSECPSKMIFFAWLLFRNRNLSWENLKKRGWQGPGCCPMCRSDEESNWHLFLNCHIAQHLWLFVENWFGVQHMSHSSISDAFFWWSQQKVIWRPLFIICLWSIWKARNNSIFNIIICSPVDIFSKVVLSYESLPSKAPKVKGDVLPSGPQDIPSFPCAFFDGAERRGICGCRVFILINDSCHFSIHWNGGKGSNSKAEAMALAGLLYFWSFLDIRHVSIFGDSKVMVYFVHKKNNISMPHLAGWMNRIRSLWDDMYESSKSH